MIYTNMWLYLQEFLSILHEIKAVLNPTSGDFCPLLAKLLSSLKLNLTYKRNTIL